MNMVGRGQAPRSLRRWHRGEGQIYPFCSRMANRAWRIGEFIRRMRRIPILLLCVMALSALLLLLVGCGGGGSQGQGGQQDHTTHHQSANVKLTLHPEHHSGVRGTRFLRGHLRRGARKATTCAISPRPTRSTSPTSTLALAREGIPMSTAVRTARKGTATNTVGALTSMAELILSTRSRR